MAEMKEAFRPRRDLKYFNAMASTSSAGGDVVGFGVGASESEGDSLGVPKGGDTRVWLSVEADCVVLNAVSSAEDAEADTGGGWAMKVNGLETEVPAPKPANPANLG